MKQNLQTYSADEIKNLTKIRVGETKLGERINQNWQAQDVKFVLVGIAEDIGVKVNKGIGGTATTWQSFLNAFLNIQSISRLRGLEVGIYGCLSFDELKDAINAESVEKIDELVEKVIFEISNCGKIPIVIGGGHNNAYPIIKAISKAQKQAINTINLDAHADFRAAEGRHSGNGFRYAMQENFLKKYAIIALHENYNSQVIIDEIMGNKNIQFTFWEDIFLREKLNFQEAIREAISFIKNAPNGVELDLDCIENVLSSAMTPCGISSTHARQYIYQTAIHQPLYLHICEGATQLETGQQFSSLGKLISYLVSDFMKVYLESSINLDE